MVEYFPWSWVLNPTIVMELFTVAFVQLFENLGRESMGDYLCLFNIICLCKEFCVMRLLVWL